MLLNELLERLLNLAHALNGVQAASAEVTWTAYRHRGATAITVQARCQKLLRRLEDRAPQQLSHRQLSLPRTMSAAR